MSVLRITTLGIVVLFLEQLRICESRSCSWSKNTAVSVDSCPESKDEVEKRAKIKNCASLAFIQNCTSPAKFQYHCLIDEAEKTFIEVCVPSYNILLGYCAEYNTIGALVQQHRGLRCSDMDPACPQLYISTDAYIYKGCYEIVKRRRQTTSSDNIFELSTKFTTKEINKNVSRENSDTVKPLNAGMIIGITFAVVVVLIAIVTIFMVIRIKIHRKRTSLMNVCSRRNANEKSLIQGNKEHATLIDSSHWTPDESIEMRSGYETGSSTIEMSDSSSEENKEDKEESDTEDKKEKKCNVEEYKEEMDRAKVLKDTVAVKDNMKAAIAEQKKEDAANFIQAYRYVCKCFVKTGLLKKCQSSLQKYGITILSGQQGCGKTLSAVYIMSKIRHYKKWTKLKFSSWVDLLTLELEANTLIYIDNLFDGYTYMYPEELRKWWCSLCFFYFEKIQGKKDIHLLITAKDDVMKEAFEQIKTDIGKCPFYLKAGNVPLTAEERKQILESQFKLAEKLKGIKNPEIISTYADIQKKDTISAIGFPLCAHLYAFETDKIYKTKDIFTDPVSYVIRHFKREIENDNSNSVKTLFMFLLFYTSPGSFKSSRGLDIKYGEEIRDYLENTKVAPENLVNEMEPLNFENLHTTAESLIYTILVKPSTMFEFKHQIYLDGASDYFLRKYSDVAIRNFPLDIIRSYAFPDAYTSDWNNLRQRFKRELQKNISLQETEMDIESCKSVIPEVLSCKIFDDEQFEINFTEELKKSSAIYFSLLNKKLCFAFWASRFGRKTLLAAAYSFVEHSDYQFYQGLFSECFGKDKKYYSTPSVDLDLITIKQKVWKFKTADGKSILHLVISSDRPDYETHLVLEKILRDTWEQDVLLINDLLKCASEHRTCSRILCMIELLGKQNKSLTGYKPPDVSNIIAQLKFIKDYNAHFELEFLVRICLVLAVCEAPIKKVNTDYNSIDERFRRVRKLLGGNEHTQSRMTETVKECLAKCQTSILPSLETKSIPFTDRIGSELKQAIQDSVQVLSRKRVLAEKVDVN